MTASLTFSGTIGATYSVPGTHTLVGSNLSYITTTAIGASGGDAFTQFFDSAVCSGECSVGGFLTYGSGSNEVGYCFLDASLTGFSLVISGSNWTLRKEVLGSGSTTIASLGSQPNTGTDEIYVLFDTATGDIDVTRNGTSILTGTYTDTLTGLRAGLQTYGGYGGTFGAYGSLDTVTTSSSNTIDSLDTPIRPGKVLNITTTGLGTLTTATTIGGKAIAAANATGGDGTITAASFVNGETYPAMGSVTVVASDGTNTASLGGQTLSTLDNYATVTIATPVDESAFSLFNAWPEGDPPQSGEVVHYPDDGTGYVDTDLMLVDFATGTHTFWVRRYDGVMYSFTAEITESGVSETSGISRAGLSYSGISEAVITTAGLSR